MLGRRKEGGRKDDALRLLFTTDLHGSESAFRKFVNAALEFKVDVALLGGDLTGKTLVPVLRSNGGYTAEFMGRQLKASAVDELSDLERTIRLAGQYPFRTTQEQTERMRGNPAEVDRVFLEAMQVSIRGWLDLAAERLGPRGIRMLAIAGNDDPRGIDDVLRGHYYVECVDADPVEIEPGVQVVGFSGANRTPWKSPREYDEPEIHEILEERIKALDDPGRSIWNVHVPPQDSGLDTCPVVRPDLTVVTDGGEPRLHGAGSSAVRDLIEQYQPMLSVHGHIHESRAISNLGKTVAVNPGSEYTEGILRAAFIRIDPKRGVRAQLLSA